MKWVAVLKSDQFVHRVVGLFDTQEQAEAWIGYQYHWYTCEIELDHAVAPPPRDSRI